MVNLRIDNVEDLLPVLSYEYIRSALDLPDYEDMFKTHMEKYLRGRGHPDCPGTRLFLTDKVFARDSAKETLRAESLLVAMTGLPYIPVGSDFMV